MPHRAVIRLEGAVGVLDERAFRIAGTAHESITQRVRAFIVEPRTVGIATGMDQRKTMHIEIEGRARTFGRIPDKSRMDELDFLLDLK